MWQRVLWPIDDSQVLFAAALQRRLDQPLLSADEPFNRLDDHTLASAFGERFPPRNSLSLTFGAGQVDDLESCLVE